MDAPTERTINNKGKYPVIENKMKWISVKKELPEKGKSVLVLSNTYGIKEDYYAFTVEGCVWFGGTREEYDDTVTHWMPKPELPTD